MEFLSAMNWIIRILAELVCSGNLSYGLWSGDYLFGLGICFGQKATLGLFVFNNLPISDSYTINDLPVSREVVRA